MINNTRLTYFSPYDNCQDALIAFISSAKKSIRLADYSFNLPQIAQILIDKHKAGLDVQVVLDKSQSGGSTEKPEVKMLQDAGVPLMIGTSEKHKIMHLKMCVIDGEATLSGSYNFTSTAAQECNTFDTEVDVDRATQFTNNWQKVWDWIKANQKQVLLDLAATE